MITEESDIVLAETDGTLSTALTANDILAKVRLVREVSETVMVDKVHYGTIPGCGDKPTLFQPGAQLLAMTFCLTPHYETKTIDMGGGHREKEVTCTLVSSSGLVVGAGIGSCTTLESKYRYRGSELNDLGLEVPKAYWALSKDERRSQRGYDLLGGKDRIVKKSDEGVWGIYIKGERYENPDIADTYNTVLKMAKKRAFVDAVLTATAATEMFTQDLEDLPEAPAAPLGAASQDTPKSAPKKEKNALLANVETLVARYMGLTGWSKAQTVSKMNESLKVKVQDIRSESEAIEAEKVVSAMIDDLGVEVLEVEISEEDIKF